MATFLSHLYTQSKLMCAAPLCTYIHVHIYSLFTYMQTLEVFLCQHKLETNIPYWLQRGNKKMKHFSLVLLFFLLLLLMFLLLWCHGLYFHSSIYSSQERHILYDTLELQVVSVTAITKPTVYLCMLLKWKVSLIFTNVSRKKNELFILIRLMCDIQSSHGGGFLCFVCANIFQPFSRTMHVHLAWCEWSLLYYMPFVFATGNPFRCSRFLTRYPFRYSVRFIQC